MELLKNKFQLFVSLIFLFFVTWWATFQSTVEEQGSTVQWFGGTYGLVALVGAIIGFAAAKKWGGFKTVLGKALMFFSLGLLAQEVGQLIYTYYVYGAKIEIPYPSWGDAAYFGSVLLYIYGAVLLAKAAGLKFSLKNAKSRLIAFIVPSAMLIFSYWMFLRDRVYDTSNPLTVFLDFGYPMGQAIYISLAIAAYLLSRKMLGGVMRAGILMVIFALIVQYIADFSFIYQSSRETYLAGKYVDLIYLVAYFMMAMSMIKFSEIYNDLKKRGESVKKGDLQETT